MSGWKYYFPDGGEGPDDARDFPKSAQIWEAEDAARIACERDYSCHDGWERGEREFPIVVIAPDGTEHKFRGHHEPSVEHRVSEDA